MPACTLLPLLVSFLPKKDDIVAFSLAYVASLLAYSACTYMYQAYSACTYMYIMCTYVHYGPTVFRALLRGLETALGGEREIRISVGNCGRAWSHQLLAHLPYPYHYGLSTAHTHGRGDQWMKLGRISLSLYLSLMLSPPLVLGRAPGVVRMPPISSGWWGRH